MDRRLVTIIAVALMVVPLAFFGCKGRVDKQAEAPKTETTEAAMPPEEVVVTQTPVTEPSQTIEQETIPPTAAVPETAQKASATPVERMDRNREIQKALQIAGFYTGAIDGKIGPKTKKSIEEFQKAKGLKVDGKVGPRTWAELEKYLKQ